MSSYTVLLKYASSRVCFQSLHIYSKATKICRLNRKKCNTKQKQLPIIIQFFIIILKIINSEVNFLKACCDILGTTLSCSVCTTSFSIHSLKFKAITQLSAEDIELKHVSRLKPITSGGGVVCRCRSLTQMLFLKSSPRNPQILQ